MTIHQLIIDLTINQIWVVWIWIWFIRNKQSFDWKVRFDFDFWFEILNWKTDLMIDRLFIDWLKVKFKWLSKSHNQLIKLFCRSSKLLSILQIGLFFCLFSIDIIHLLTSLNLIESLKWLEQFWDSLICWLTFDLLCCSPTPRVSMN